MIPGEDTAAISFIRSLDRTNLVLDDVDQDSPIVRSSFTYLDKCTKQLQSSSQTVLRDVAQVREHMTILRASEARLDESVAELATLLPAFARAALPSWSAYRRGVAASRHEAEEILLNALDHPLHTIMNRCNLARNAQRFYERESRGYYSDTHRWLGRGRPSTTAPSAPSEDHQASSSSSVVNEPPGLIEESQLCRDLRFLLARLQLYEELLGLHGGKAELCMAQAVLRAARYPQQVEGERMSWSDCLMAEEHHIERQRSACRDRIIAVEQQLTISSEAEHSGANSLKLVEERPRARSRSPKKQPNHHQSASSSERVTTDVFRDFRRQVADRLQGVPSSTSSSSLLGASFSSAFQRLKSNHHASSISESDPRPRSSGYTHLKAARERAAATTVPSTPVRFSFIRVPSGSRKYPPRRSVSLSNKVRESAIPAGTSTVPINGTIARPSMPASDTPPTPQHPFSERSDPSGSSFDWVSIGGRRNSLQPSTGPSSSLTPSITSPQREVLNRSPLRKKEGILWVMSKHLPASFDSSEAPRGVNRSSQWREAWVVVSTGHIAEYADWREKNALLTPSHPMIDLRFATVREAKAVERKFSFEIVTRDSRRFYQASSEEAMREWTRTIVNAIESLLNGTSSVRQVDKVARIEGEANRLGGTSAFPRLSFDELGESPRWSQSFSELGVAVKPGKLFGGRGGGNGHRESRTGTEVAPQQMTGTAPGSSATLAHHGEASASTASSGISNWTPLSKYVQAQGTKGPRSPSKAQYEDTFFDQQIAAAVLSSYGSGGGGDGEILCPPSLLVTSASSDIPFSGPQRLPVAPSHPRSSPAAAKEGCVHPSAPLSNRALEEEIDRLSRLPENSWCADCSSPNPRWASWSLLGSNCCIFLCIVCSGVHRSLGVHLSRVKSVDLDVWTEEQVSNAREWGNEKVNAIFEELREEREGGTVVVGEEREERIREKGNHFWVKKYVEQAWRRNPSEPLVSE